MRRDTSLHEKTGRYLMIPLLIRHAVLVLVLLATGSTAPAPTAQAGEAPYLVLVSIDGFRHDYPDLYPTPALARIAAAGVRAASLRPVWPTLTFPNHYSIATGLYPAEHGIVGNRFPAADRESWYEYKDRTTVQDGRWYGGEPIWVAAERAGLPAAAYYFVGTEAPVGGVSPSDWRAFDDGVPGEARVAQALDWLARPDETRPHVVTLYFEHVDVASHRHGPGSAEAAAAVATVDGWLGELLDGIARLPVARQTYVVVVSDHGQLPTRLDEPSFVIEEVANLDGVQVVNHGSLAMLFLDPAERERAAGLRDAINARWEHGRAWLRDEAPAAWHVAGSPRMPDLLVQADPGYTVVSRAGGEVKLTAGDHGWAPETAGMHGVFLACGPGLPAGRRLPAIGAVDVYPLLLDMLGLPDGRGVDRESPLAGLLE